MEMRSLLELPGQWSGSRVGAAYKVEYGPQVHSIPGASAG